MPAHPRLRLRTALILGSLGCLITSRAAAQAFPMPNPPPAAPPPTAPPPAVHPRPGSSPPPAPTPARTAPVSPAPAPAVAPAPPKTPAPAAAPSVAPPPAAYPTPATTPAPVAPALQPTAAVDAAPAIEPAEEAPDKRECALDEFCFGGVLTGGVLNVFGVGIHARMEYWGIGFDYQFISLGYEDVDGDLGLFSIDARVYPFGGAFFFSAGFAWQSIALETDVTVDPGNGIPEQQVNAKGNVTMPLFRLGVGFMGRSGFVMGIDLSLGFRLGDLNPTVETDLPRLPEVVEAETEFRDAAEAWLEWLPITPQLNVLRIGYLF